MHLPMSVAAAALKGWLSDSAMPDKLTTVLVQLEYKHL